MPDVHPTNGPRSRAVPGRYALRREISRTFNIMLQQNKKARYKNTWNESAFRDSFMPLRGNMRDVPTNMTNYGGKFVISKPVAARTSGSEAYR